MSYELNVMSGMTRFNTINTNGVAVSGITCATPFNYSNY